MIASACTTSPLRRVLATLVPAALGILAIARAPVTFAQGTHLWTQSQPDEFQKGTPNGVAITSDGRLREGPALTEILTTPSTFVWSVAADKNGVAYLATGSPASVLRVGKDAKPFTLFKTKDITVQVVRFGPDGALYAATLPSGKVYKLNPDATEAQDESTAKVIFDAARLPGAAPDGTAAKSGDDKSGSKPYYVWDLLFDRSGRLYIAAGDPGAVYRVDPAKPNAAPETFFKTDEAHIRTLAWDAKGNLIAGSDGSGLVYRISPDGKGYVLFDSPRREVTSVAVAADGTIYAACVGDRGRSPLPPLPVQGVGSVTITVVQPGSMEAVNKSTAIPEGTEIYALEENRAPRKLWEGKEEIVYSLAARKDGLLALSGNRGRIFRIQGDGGYADIGHLDAQQGLSMAAEGGDVLVGTGNTGKLFRMSATGTHQYASDVLDTGSWSRFGRVEIEPGSSGYQIFTRTGNIEQPARGWTEWEPLKDGVVASPAGRFLQWKAELNAGGNVGSVGVNYLPVNTAPVVDDLVVVTGARLNPQNQMTQEKTVNIAFPSSGQNTISFDAGSSNNPLQAVKDRSAITARWAAHDDGGDDLIYSLYLRGDGETRWRLLKDKLTDKAYSFDATLIPDGGYHLRVVASDSPSETPADALTGEKISDRFVVDTTPPVVSNLKAAGQPATCRDSRCPSPFEVTLDAEDATSPIARAEYSLDAGPWQHIDPVGKISDSQHERYDFKVVLDAVSGKIGEHLITVRVYDRYDNVGVAKTVIPGQE